MGLRCLGIGLAFAAGLGASAGVAQERQTLRIAGLSLGAPVSNLPDALAAHGFVPLAKPTDPSLQARTNAGTFATTEFQRRDGHRLSVGTERTANPTIRALGYDMARDETTYQNIHTHLRALFGAPSVVHGTEASVRVAVWEILRPEMTVEGQLTTMITLIRDPVQGHSLSVREIYKRPDFGTAGGGAAPSLRSSRSPD